MIVMEWNSRLHLMSIPDKLLNCYLLGGKIKMHMNFLKRYFTRVHYIHLEPLST